MIYVPDKESYECYVVQSEGVIRAYEQKPANGLTINYRDYYIDSNYIFRDGYQTFSNYASIPVCLDNANVTSDFYYRNDFDSILIIFLIILIIGFLLPFKIVTRFFKRLR